MTDRVLVTGATGFLGRALLPILTARAGVEVHAVARHAPLGTAECVSDSVTWHGCDLLAPGAPRELCRSVGATYLVHLAWCARAGYWTSPENLDWLAASLLLLREFAAHGGTRFVGTGTGAEYRATTEACDERTSETGPTTVYGMAKDALARLAFTVSGDLGVDVAWARMFQLYGPHEAEARLVPSVVLGLLAGDEVTTSAGEQVRDFIHVSDAAAALDRLTFAPVVGPVNVGTGVPTAVASVVEHIARLIGRTDLVRAGGRPPATGEALRVVASTRRLHDEVGYRPRIPLEDGLRATVQWWRTAFDSR